MRSVFIAYGFSEGTWNSRRLRTALGDFDLTLAPSLQAADIVLTHSAGCIDLPELSDSQTLAMINPTYWPGKTKSERARAVFGQNLYETFRGQNRWYHVAKFFHFLWQLVRHADRNRTIVKRVDTFDLSQEVKHPRALIIHNHGDPWLTADLSGLQTTNPSWKVFHLNGYHDDCWVNPGPYLKIISENS